MLFPPLPRTIQPRYEVRTLKDGDGKPWKLAVRDNSRGCYVRTLPLSTPDRMVGKVVAELERTYRPASVIYRVQRITADGRDPWELTVAHGDVIEQNYRYRIVMDLGRNLHMVPAERHVRTIWGSIVMRHFGEARNGPGVITHDSLDIEGWTEPRHQELYQAVHSGSTAAWFAHFMLRYNLGAKHWQWEEYVTKNSPWLPVNANGGALHLLRHWDREHPEVARRLYGIEEDTK